ncbi:MAG: hypothetical protein COA97_01515 [Flavobacteriales bacterium]|nr:MAG: hypothetical protein COA97_01515 [Flavobacteriales bacterium]
MKKSNIFKTLTLAIGLVAYTVSFAQCDTIASLCDRHITSNFISDGQDYRSLLLDDEIAEFNMTLYGGSTYRFAACSGLSDGNLIFSVYDKERNLLFTNKDYANSPYWDFEITNTLDCIIEAHLDPNNLASGCAVLLVGFKQ